MKQRVITESNLKCFELVFTCHPMWSSMPAEIIAMIRVLLEDEFTILYADTDSIMIREKKSELFLFVDDTQK